MLTCSTLMRHGHIKYSIGQIEPEFNEFPVNLQYCGSCSYRPLRSNEKMIYMRLDFAPEAQCFGFFSVCLSDVMSQRLK